MVLKLFAVSLLVGATVFPQSDPDALVKEGRRLNNEGKHDEAIALFHQALKASPESYDAHMAAGIALDLKGNYAEARKHLAKALEVAPAQSKAQALQTMSISYAFDRNCKEAVKYGRQVFDMRMAANDFVAGADRANEIARLCLESGDVDEAQNWYKTGYDTVRRKTDLSAADTALWTFRWEHAQARVAARRGNKDDAQKHVTVAKAIFDKGIDPAQAPFFPYLLGYVAFYGGDYKAALAELQKSNQRDPFILSLIAQTYEKLGDKSQATEYYRKVMTFNMHNPTNAFARPLAQKKLS